ncbi:MAG TPA: GGDEF domain-containing protein [Clostridiales bacterium]|nr:GGDEF domain-containing protein [Clostridiales bacterium]
MIKNGRKTIGAFITNLDEDYPSLISRGIVSMAKELDYNVVFFSGYEIDGEKDNYNNKGEVEIINLPNYSDLDGIILVPATYSLKELESKLKTKLSSEKKTPIITILREKDESYNVLIDNDIILTEIVEHFIVVHKFNRINFLSGPKHSTDSMGRLETYRRVLKEHNIPIEEERIHYGDFWATSAYDAVEKFLSSKLEIPQAIVCANDLMAMGVCNELIKRGIRVPQDIAVSGCDNLPEVASYFPSITTAEIPFYDMGRTAVKTIDNAHKNIKQETDKYEQFKTIYRESCGCVKEPYDKNIQYRRSLALELEELRAATKTNAKMSTDLTGLMTLDDITDKIYSSLHINKCFKSFYLCLKEDWQQSYYSNWKTEHNYDKMVMYLGVKNKKRLANIEFPQEIFLPEVAIDDEPQMFYVSLLHHQEKYFGYAAISYNINLTHTRVYQPWLINISNALENIRVSEELNSALFKLEDLYIRDPLTGLYNRRGLSILAEKYLRQSLQDNCLVMVFTADMDNLKKVNDQYGHIQGDIAIKAIANSLQKAADDDELCIRSGGDEFIVVGIEYNEEKLERFINNFNNEIAKYNKRANHPFVISTSYGSVLISPDEDTKLNEVLNVADNKMYEQKKKKRAMKLI